MSSLRSSSMSLSSVAEPSGENLDRAEHASGSIYEPGYLRRSANGHLLSRAIRHGITPPDLERLELPLQHVLRDSSA